MDILGQELYNIRQVLDVQNEISKVQTEIFRRMLNIMRKPENKFKSLLEKVVLIVSAMGLLNIIDTIIKWVIGG